MMYKSFDADDLAALRALEGEGSVLCGDEIPEEYAHDELGGARRAPDAVVAALDAEKVSAVMRFANERHIPVTPRGAGTGLVGACVPVEGGIVLDMSRMNRIIELDEENLTVTVEPGVLLMELARFAEEHGLLYPPDPGEKTATIGGNISTNAGGMRAVKYGVTRDYVRSLEVVLPTGERLTLGGKTVKNSSGYSLKDLVIGSEGTLAVITRATLRLIPKPARSISLLVPFPDLKSAIGTVPLIMRSRANPTAVEFMQSEVIADAESYLGAQFPDDSGQAYLLLKFDGPGRREIEEAYEEVAKICLDAGAFDLLISDTDERDEMLWTPRGAFLEAIKSSTDEMDELDIVVPRSRVHELVEYTHTLEQTHGVRIKSFGHAGDGNLHIYVLRDGLDAPEWQARLTRVMDDAYGMGESLGGQVSGEHGIGFAKKGYLTRSLDPAAVALMKGIKAAFDPNNVLNPSKLFD